MTEIMHFDIVMISDFRTPGGTSIALATEIGALHGAGLKIGLLQVDMPYYNITVPSPAILDCIRFGWARWIQSEQRIACELLALHNPAFFGQVKFPRHNIRSRHRIVVVHHVPSGPTGTLNYDPWRLDASFRRSFGGDFIWAPVSPVCRAQFKKIAFDLPLLAENWHNVIKVEEWGFPRPSPRFSSCVIGRHSRPDPDKWPKSRNEILQCYSPELGFEVRILGAEWYLKRLIGEVPHNWRLFAFDEIAPKEFLQSIDFFVYFHHPLTIEAFGRAPAEAAAAGCVLVLPPYLRETFGDAAVYCEPKDVAAIVRRYQADPEAYCRQSRRGYDIVRERFGPESLLRLARSTMIEPNVAAGRKESGSDLLKDALFRFRLKIRYRTREIFRRLIRKVLRALLPKSVHDRLKQLAKGPLSGRLRDRVVMLKK